MTCKSRRREDVRKLEATDSFYLYKKSHEATYCTLMMKETVSRCRSEDSFAIHFSYINYDIIEIRNNNSKAGETSMLGGEEPRRCHPNAL